MQENTQTEPVLDTAAEKNVEASAPLSVPHAIIWNGVIIGAAIIVAALIIGYGRFATEPSQDAADDTPAATVDANIKNVNFAGMPYIGSANAPVALAYWSDFQCPYCKQFEMEEFQEIVKNYVASGKVAVVFKDFAFLGSDSTTAALYSRAVWALYPEQYFAWRTAMYEAQDAENAGFGDEASVKKLTAAIAGIDAAKVAEAVVANKAAYQKALDADRVEAVNFGIGGTPSFITGAALIRGVSPYGTFEKAFDKQLK
jgi:protein-disulfide isomerase